jgi:hypothetical protein
VDYPLNHTGNMRFFPESQPLSPLQAIDDRVPALLPTPTSGRSSILFIDSAVTDWQTLAQAAKAGSEVYQLDGSDAVAQITQTLLGRHDIASLQLISHGRSGGLQLGEDWLDLPNLPRYVAQLKSWGEALTADADILLYGCNVAQAATGKAFVNLLAEATGADIAASDNVTGAGGDWNLEVATGAIESELTIASPILNAYTSQLDLAVDSSLTLPGLSNGSIAWGDYSGDGKLDLILTGSDDTGKLISKLYKNNGSGGLIEDTSITLPGLIYSAVAWGDYSGDGKLDLIITGNTQPSSDPISKLYKNNGNGGLVEDSSITLPGVVGGSVAWGDYSGDGKLDLILTGGNYPSNITKLYKNNGSGGLVEDTSINLPVIVFGGVAWGDYSGDGKLDLILTGFGGPSNVGTTKLFKNNGNSGLVEDTSITLPGVYLSSVAWGDYSGDGKLDLVITGENFDNSQVNTSSKLYKNNGIGGFTEDTSVTLPGVSNGSVAWGDYSGDGKLDLILTGNGTKLYKNTGSGSLTADTTIALPGVTYSSAAWGDYSGDGKLDLIFIGASGFGRITKLYKNDGFNGLNTDNSLNLPAIYNGAVAWGDYSGDGQLDLVITGNDGSDLITKLYKSNGSGGLTEDTSIRLPPGFKGAVAWGDYSGDGKLDLFIGGKFYKNNGIGGLTEDPSITLLLGFYESFAWGDYSGDGKLDFISGRKLYKNNGRSGFTEDASITLPALGDGEAAWGDYTGDGKLDLIITGYGVIPRPEAPSSYPVTKLYKNNGRGGLVEDLNSTLPAVSGGSVAWGDYTGDGKLDLIIMGSDGTGGIRENDGRLLSTGLTNKLYKNNGSGDFIEDTSITLPSIDYGSVAWGDYSGDGRLDLILTGYTPLYDVPGRVPITKLYKNNGRGGLVEDPSISLPEVFYSAMAWGDYSGDGNLDLIFTGATKTGPITKLYKNLTNTPPTPRSEIFWRNSQTNQSVVWNSQNGTQLVAGRLLTYGTGAGANLVGKPVLYDQSWRLVNTIDLNGDKVRDLVYSRNGEIRVLTVGQVNGQTTTIEADREFTFASTKFGSLNGQAARPLNGWELVGVEDMTGDGQGDFVFYSRSLDRTVVWQTNTAGQIVDGGFVTSAASPGGQMTGAPNSWNIQALGDFTGDGKTDILWRNAQNVIVLWEMNGTQLNTAKSGVLPSLGSNFQVKGVGDFNHDGIKDLLWRDQTGNVNRIWIFGTNGRPTEISLIEAANSQWEIEDVADMNRDGTDDIIWRNNQNNYVYVWNIQNAALSVPGSGYVLNYLPGGNKQPIGPSDLSWSIDAVTAI